MWSSRGWCAVLIGVGVTLWGAWAVLGQPSAPRGGVGPVVVELFTSEGCSSCPPADDIVRELGQGSRGDGPQVIVLGEHVDYWNRLGWIDTYSAPVFSQRQRAYANRLGLNGLYTPQVVIDGQWECVGSDRSRIRKLLSEAALRPRQAIGLEIRPTADPRTFSIHVRLDGVHGPMVGTTAEVILAVTEEGLRTQVPRGENAGRLLRHAAVVRSLAPIGTLGGSKRIDTDLRLEPGWDPARIRVVALLQEAGGGCILGSVADRMPVSM